MTIIELLHPFSHELIAVSFQLVMLAVFHSAWIGAIAATAFYLSREIAQAEYRWIEHYGDGQRSRMKWWNPYEPRVWNLKSLSDWMAPAALTIAIAIFL